MSNQVLFVFTRKSTLITCERLGWVVSLHVASQVCSSGESLAAYITGKRLFSGVLPVMDNQLWVRHPRPTAYTTLKRTLHARMCLQVSSKNTTECCSIVTLATFIRQFTRMLVHVCSQLMFL